MNLQTIIEKTLNEALPGMIQSRVNASLESAINPAIDAAIASALSNVLGNPAPVKAAPVAKPSSQVRVKAPTPKAKPVKAPAKPVAPAVPECVVNVDHGSMYRDTKCIKDRRRWAQFGDAVLDVAVRDNARASKFARVTPLAGISNRDAERLCQLGFRCRVLNGQTIFLGNRAADAALAAATTLNRY